MRDKVEERKSRFTTEEKVEPKNEVKEVKMTKAVEEEKFEPIIVRATTYLNARTGPGLEFSSQKIYAPDEEVKMVGEENGWYKSEAGLYTMKEYFKK